jgi:hypothetical protein
MKAKKSILHFLGNIHIILGVILVWRGVWYILDGLDYFLLGGNHFWAAFVGLLFGLGLLYWHDKDLDEI